MADRYRSRPVEVEALQWNGDNLDEVTEFCGTHAHHGSRSILMVKTLHGWVDVLPGAWICKGPLDFWPVVAEEFERKYERVDDDGEG